MKNWKLVLIAVGLLFVAIAIVQNTEDVTTRLLFFEASMPRAVLLIATFAIGFAVGLLVALRLKRAPAGKTPDKP